MNILQRLFSKSPKENNEYAIVKAMTDEELDQAAGDFLESQLACKKVVKILSGSRAMLQEVFIDRC